MYKKSLIFVLFLLLCLASAEDNADGEVYIDYPAGAWADWSWATRDMRSTTYVHSYQYAVRAQLNPWTAVRFHHEGGGLNTTGFTHLQFWVHGGTQGGQQFSLKVAVKGADRAAVPITNYTTIPANQWVQVQVPLTDLGVSNAQRLTDLYFIETRGSSVPAFWLDDIKLIKPLPPVLPSIRVDAKQVLRSLPPLMFGVNTATWDWNLNVTGTRDRLKEGGFTALRFPGGSTSDEYDWRNNRNKRTGTTYGTNTDGFLAVANAVGAEKMITVNYGSGTPTEARDWVQYANITRNGNVLYWNIGNECYGSWEYDTHPNQHDAYTYAYFVRDSIQLMKAVDPRIKIGIVGTWSETDYPQRFSVTNPRTGRSVNGWSAVLLKTLHDLNVTPDFYDIHYYPCAPGRESDSGLLQSAKDWISILQAARQLLQDYLGSEAENVALYITENNSVWGNPGKQTTSLVNALYLIDSWGQAFLAGVGAFVWWDLHNGTATGNNNSPLLYGWRNYGDYGLLASGSQGGEPLNTPYPAFYAFKLLKRFTRPGDRLVFASSNHELLSVYASLTVKTGRLRLLVINKARNMDLNTTVYLTGYVPGSRAYVYRYGIQEDQNRRDVQRSQIRVSGTQLRLNLPRYSITVVEF